MRRSAAVLTGLLLGVGIGILLSDGRVVAALSVLLFGCALAAVVRGLVPPADRQAAAMLIALAFALRVATAVVLYTAALAVGRGGFIPGDDRVYADVAAALASYWHGQPQPPLVPPLWAGHAYLMGTWVYLESAIFYVIGPDVLVPILMNARSRGRGM